MPFDIRDSGVLVTGASSGIGAGVAVEAAQRGARVGLVGRDRDRLAGVLERCREHDPGAAMWKCDLADADQRDLMVEAAVEHLGGIDVLVNNAGIPKRRHVTRLTSVEIETVMRINYLAPVDLALVVLPRMLSRGEGRIINVASVAASLSSPGEAAYNASKAALTVWSETASVDLAGTGVRVHVIHPGVVDTPLFELPGNDEFTHPVEAIPVSEAVEAVLAPLQSDDLIVYVPEFFADVAKTKAADPQGFLEGVADWVREQHP